MIVYKVTNKINSKIYVGQTVGDLEIRKYHHLNSSVNGSKLPFYKAIRKYAPENFYWEILERCDTIEELNEREKYWIRELNTIAPGGYNLTSGGNNYLVHEETRKKISESLKGRKHTEKSKMKMFKAKKGVSLSKEHCKNISKSLKGKKYTEEIIKKLSEAKKGISLSKDHRRKLSEAKKGTIVSEKTRKKISKSTRGENNYNSKLTEADVLEIRYMYKQGISYTEIAKIKNSTYQNVYRVVNHKSWKYIS